MKRTILVFVILAGFLSGCASSVVLDSDKIHSMAKGKTTVAEASSLFGKPYLMVSPVKWRERILYETLCVWDHAEADLIDQSGQKIPQKGFLIATFDEDGILMFFKATGTTSDTMIDYWNAPRK